MKKIFFHGLNEVRALAALFVIFSHIELYKHKGGNFSLYDTQLHYFISQLGKNGVYIFFVLSGFLITYLLLTEKKANSKIEIRKFYFRRILRIWPLYYLIVFISFFIIPILANNIVALQNEHSYYENIERLEMSPYFTFFLFLVFLPNLAILIRPPVVGASHTWSVGVEEQFYLVWPILINYVKNKMVLLLLLLSIAFIPVLFSILKFLFPPVTNTLSFILELIPIYFMGIGGIGAYFLFYKKSLVSKISQNAILFSINTILILIFLFVDFYVPYRLVIFGFLVALELLFITETKFKINIRNPFLNNLGVVSYGLYMYHPLIMYFCFAFWNSIMPIENYILYNILAYSSIILITIGISKVSYNYFELKFIQLKNKKFTIIKSGNSADPVS